MQPLPPEDHSGELLQYKILLHNGHEEMCAAASSLCLVQVPADVQALSVSAVTSYGTSPPANLDLRHTGKLILQCNVQNLHFKILTFSHCVGLLLPILQDLTPADNGSSLFVSWASTFGKEVLHFVIQWDNVPANSLQWKMLAKDQRNASISGINIF